ncbi:unnamed protein product, partial [Rotaria sordida]
GSGGSAGWLTPLNTTQPETSSSRNTATSRQ